MKTIAVACAIGMICNACNMTSMVTYSQGQAEDFVDLSETNTPDVKPTTDISIPAAVL